MLVGLAQHLYSLIDAINTETFRRLYNTRHIPAIVPTFLQMNEINQCYNFAQ